jgi:scyllo-inositol 2-dehydrogenase (NADP+)
MTLRVALIGRGMAGTILHAPLIRAVPELELTAIVGSADAAAAIAARGIDLVVVATPNPSHFRLAEAALRAGKHVVVDKPFTLTVDEADALIALAVKCGRMLSVFHNRRWDGDFLTVRRLIESRQLGELMLYEAHWDRFRPAIKQGWREQPAAGSGLFFDLGPHLIDQALVLFGVPEALSADIACQRNGAQVDDYFSVTFHYGRLRAILSASTLIAAARPRFALHGTEGSFVKNGLDIQEAALGNAADPAQSGFGEDPNDGIVTLADGTASAVRTSAGRYLAFYEGVAASLLSGAVPPVDPADARQGLRLLALARLSALEGRRVTSADANSPATGAPADLRSPSL